jgi:hypothetical protein
MTQGGPDPRVHDAVNSRIFVVGCPRSGTTLVQAFLASHPDVFTLPETHYFNKVWGRMRRFQALHVISPRRAARILDGLVESAGVVGRRPSVPKWWPFYGLYAHAFQSVMDDAAAAARKNSWVEKSPAHLHRIRDIEEYVTTPSFLHVVRNGRDVVASFYEQCMTQPDRWIGQVLAGNWRQHLACEAGTHAILLAVVERWNRDVRITSDMTDRDHHHVVRYEDLVTDPKTVAQSICEAVGVEFVDDMLDHRNAADRVVGWRSQYPHMTAVFGPLRDAPASRFRQVLTTEQQDIALKFLSRGGDPPGLPLVSVEGIVNPRRTGD